MNIWLHCDSCTSYATHKTPKGRFCDTHYRKHYCYCGRETFARTECKQHYRKRERKRDVRSEQLNVMPQCNKCRVPIIHCNCRVMKICLKGCEFRTFDISQMYCGKCCPQD